MDRRCLDWLVVFGVVATTATTQVATWTELMPSSSPSARSQHAMAYDSQRGRTVLFGGTESPGSAGTERGDTWEWDGSTWTQVATEGPSARGQHAVAYDSQRGRTVLFGGRDATGALLDDTWEWNGSTWTRVAIGGPPAREGHAMAYDGQRGRTVLFGGNAGPVFGDTWEWDGNTWTQVSISGPSARERLAMAYDSRRGRTVLFGGRAGNAHANDTWEWDGNTWTQVATGGPSVRFGHAMAYDGDRGVTVLFGGSQNGSLVSDTWEWTGSGWFFQTRVSHPDARLDHSLAYDPRFRTTFLFGGGSGPAGTRSDTWRLRPDLGVFPSFEATPRSGASPLSVQFTDTSSTSDPGGILAWDWDFDGDGTTDSMSQNPPPFVYGCGTYSPSLTVTDSTGSATLARPGFVVVDAISADFTASQVVVTRNSAISFTDLSMPTPTSWSWDFDSDGVVDSTIQNPTYTYPNPGVFDVTLTVGNACQTASQTILSMIQVDALPGTFSTFGQGCAGSGALSSLCSSHNPTGGTLAGTTLGAEVAYLSLGHTTATQVAAFELFTQSNTGANETVTASLYLFDFVGPAATPVAQTTLVIGPSPGFYAAFFAQPVPVSGAFFIAVDHTAQTTALSDLASGMGGVCFARSGAGANWRSLPGMTPSYKIACTTGNANGAAVPLIGNNGVAEIDTSFDLTLQLAAPQSPAFLVLGFSNQTWVQGALPWPLPNAPGCDLLVSDEDWQAVVTDLVGAASVTLSVPDNPILIGNRVYHQWVVADPLVNGLGVAVSEGAESSIGG